MTDTDADQPFSPSARAYAKLLMCALDPFRAVHRTSPLQLLVTLIEVASDEGRTVSELAKRCRVSNTVMSRHLKDLGGLNRRHEPGLELVTYTQRIYGDRRERRAVLTPAGAVLLKEMFAALRAGPAVRRRRSPP